MDGWERCIRRMGYVGPWFSVLPCIRPRHGACCKSHVTLATFCSYRVQDDFALISIFLLKVQCGALLRNWLTKEVVKRFVESPHVTSLIPLTQSWYPLYGHWRINVERGQLPRDRVIELSYSICNPWTCGGTRSSHHPGISHEYS